MILQFLNRKAEPDKNFLIGCSPEVKYFWINKDLFRLHEKVLFRIKTDSRELELVLPKTLQSCALAWHHDIPSSGHQGIARTKAKLREKFFLG